MKFVTSAREEAVMVLLSVLVLKSDGVTKMRRGVKWRVCCLDNRKAVAAVILMTKKLKFWREVRGRWALRAVGRGGM
jgi:hypothetical protein